MTPRLLARISRQVSSRECVGCARSRASCSAGDADMLVRRPADRGHRAREVLEMVQDTRSQQEAGEKRELSQEGFPLHGDCDRGRQERVQRPSIERLQQPVRHLTPVTEHERSPRLPPRQSTPVDTVKRYGRGSVDSPNEFGATTKGKPAGGWCPAPQIAVTAAAPRPCPRTASLVLFFFRCRPEFVGDLSRMTQQSRPVQNVPSGMRRSRGAGTIRWCCASTRRASTSVRCG